MFGLHLVIDAYGCDKKRLSDVGQISAFLDDLPSQIGMTKIAPPYCFFYKGLRPEDCGVSGIVLIAESHISIHTFSEKGYFSADVFSCKDFDAENVADIITSKFKAKTFEKSINSRGRHFPRSEERVAQTVELARATISSPKDNNV